MKIVPTDAREELGAAAFVLKEGYSDWVWTQRVKGSTPAPKASKSWPFKRLEDENVIPLKRRAKKS